MKLTLHPRNKNIKRYDLEAMIKVVPELADIIIPNKKGENSIDFSNPESVKLLNKGLLHYYYGVHDWDFPDEHLCPPIPGRADYLHYMADLLASATYGKIPTGNKITGLDIGVGASCIYPIIGVREYDWNFIGSDINKASLDYAEKIVSANDSLKGKINLREQTDPTKILKDIVDSNQRIDFCMSNPPFHSSAEEAEEGTLRKVKNLGIKQEKKVRRNFSGVREELIYEGGESRFIQNMITESVAIGKQFLWFSSLVSKEKNVRSLVRFLQKNKPPIIKVIDTKTGNKNARILAWSYHNKKEQFKWAEKHWSLKSDEEE